MNQPQPQAEKGGRLTGALSRLLANDFIRFLAVGFINTLFGYGVFAGLMLLGVNYKISLFLSMICGTLFNFKSTGLLVFGNRENRLLYKFVFVYFSIYLINLGLLRAAKIYFTNLLAVQAALILPIAALTFTAMRLLVFSRKAPDQADTPPSAPSRK